MEDVERQELLAENVRLKQENELLRQKLDLVLRKLFGKSSEALDPAQLELLLGEPPGKAPGLIAHTLISKYCDHLPFFRQEKILATRHGVDIGRNTLCRWAELATS